MKQFIFLTLFVFSSSFAVAGQAAQEKVIFGPVKYDVKERYGKDNAYTGNFEAYEGLFIIKIENGNLPRERVELIEMKVNGETLMKSDRYNYGFIAGVIRLKKENLLELNLKDVKPSGLKRPPLPPRFVTISVMPYAGRLSEGVYGVHTWEGLQELAALLQKITKTEALALAQAAVNLKNETATRAENMRKLSERKDLSAQPFITAVFTDVSADSDVRAEAAIALGIIGSKESITPLMTGVFDSEEKIRIASGRALSFYKEEDTGELFTKKLEQLDAMRRDAVIKSIGDSGWRPQGSLLKLAESTDAHVSTTAIELLKNNQDPLVADLLLKLYDQPGSRDMKVIIAAMGATRDPRAIERLVVMAKDPEKRAGKEAELGEALADSGNPQFADLIITMIKKTESRQTLNRLREAYKKLTGKEYK